jgi:hypothetical protein
VAHTPDDHSQSAAVIASTSAFQPNRQVLHPMQDPSGSDSRSSWQIDGPAVRERSDHGRPIQLYELGSTIVPFI